MKTRPPGRGPHCPGIGAADAGSGRRRSLPPAEGDRDRGRAGLPVVDTAARRPYVSHATKGRHRHSRPLSGAREHSRDRQPAIALTLLLPLPVRPGERRGAAAHVYRRPRPGDREQPRPPRGAAPAGHPRGPGDDRRTEPNPTSCSSRRRTRPEILTFNIPFEPSKRSRSIDLAREELTLADVDDTAAVQTLRRNVRLAFYGLLAADGGSPRGQHAEGGERVQEVAQARFEEGAAPRLDVMEAELGVARAQADLELARSARGAAQADLNALLNRPPARAPRRGWRSGGGAPSPPVRAGHGPGRRREHRAARRRREAAIEERRLSLLKGRAGAHAGVLVRRGLNAPGEFDVGSARASASRFRSSPATRARSPGRSPWPTRREPGAMPLRRGRSKVFAALARVQAQRAQVEAFRETLVPTATAIEGLAEESYRLGRESDPRGARGAAHPEGREERVPGGAAGASGGRRGPGGHLGGPIQ